MPAVSGLWCLIKPLLLHCVGGADSCCCSSGGLAELQLAAAAVHGLQPFTLAILDLCLVLHCHVHGSLTAAAKVITILISLDAGILQRVGDG